MAKKQKPIPESVRRKAVRDWRAGKATAGEIGRKLGRSGAAVGYWASRFEKPETSASGLPVKAPGMRKAVAKTKQLIATRFECPHCGDSVAAERRAS